MNVFDEKHIFSNLCQYKENVKRVEKILKPKREALTHKFNYSKVRGFKDNDDSLYSCPRCGFTTHIDGNFCTNCGKKINNFNSYEKLVEEYNDFHEYSKIMKRIPKEYILPMKNDKIFTNCESYLKSFFYTVTSYQYGFEEAIRYLEAIDKYHPVSQQIILQDFRNTCLFFDDNVWGYVSNWKGYKNILDEKYSELDVVSAFCNIHVPMVGDRNKNLQTIHELGVMHSNGDLNGSGYVDAARLIGTEYIREKYGEADPLYKRTEFFDDKTCRQLLGIACMWKYADIKKKRLNPTTRMFWDLVWRCQLHPSDELKLYRLVRTLSVA